MTTGTKQTGTNDLGRFLREISERAYRIPRRALKTWAHDRNGGKVWRGILRDQSRRSK